MKRIWETSGTEKQKKRHKRGFKAQKDKREMEREMRRRTVTISRYLKRAGCTHEEAADCIEMSSSTLSSWERRWRNDRLAAKARGRPAERPDRETRNRIIEVISWLWPDVGLPFLQDIFPGVAKMEIEDLLRRFWRLALKNKPLIHSLHWARPGSVWAMDFAEPPTPIDGIYNYALAVRDLASGCNLAWLPVVLKEEAQVKAALKSLFARHGLPLVIKSDNEGAFKACRRMLRKRGVHLLLSPCYYPEYNGSCEAGIGTLKTYTHHAAARNDRPDEWTCDDVEAARQRANIFSRPWGYLGLSPEDKWLSQKPITAEERRTFTLTASRHEKILAALKGCADKDALEPLNKKEVERKSLERSLVDTGFLTVRRRRINPPFYRRKRLNIS